MRQIGDDVEVYVYPPKMILLVCVFMLEFKTTSSQKAVHLADPSYLVWLFSCKKARKLFGTIWMSRMVTNTHLVSSLT